MADDKPPTRQATDQVQFLQYLIKYFKHAGLLFLVYIVGYFGFSVTWVLLALFGYMLNEEYRKIKASKSAFAKQAILNEKNAIMARVDELPSWVFFPDVERAEWLNKMIKQMWPYIGEYVKQVLKTSVQPTIDSSMPSSLKPFKFDKIDLGDIPPRFGGVKVYTENLKKDEVILDLEVFYASDSEIKVAVRGLTAGIKDLTLHGQLRIVMKPLVSVMPIIGAMNVFFLNPPSIDFDLTNTANILDLPLLSNTLRSIITDQLAYYLVLPNKIPVQLVANLNVEDFKYPLPQGVLRLHIIAARELKRADFKLVGKGKSDPYCKIYVGAQDFKTKVIEDTINPVWNSYFEAVVDQKQGQFAEIEVLDKDPGDDDELGTASVDIENISKNGSMDTWLPLENVDTGLIHVRGLWLHLSKDPDDLEKEEGERAKRSRDLVNSVQSNYKDQIQTISEDHLSSAVLLLHLDSAKSLPRSKKAMSEPSPIAKISLGNDTRKSFPKAKTTDPKWEENFQFLIQDPRHQDLNVEIRDSSKDKKLGIVTVPLKNVLAAPDMIIHRSFPLRESSPQAKLTIRLCLRILTSEVPAEWAQDKVADVADAVPQTPVEEEEPVQPVMSDDADSRPKDQPAQPVQAESQKEVREMPVDIGESEKNFVIGGDSDAASNASSIMDQRVGTELRHRVTTPSTSSDPKFGSIQVTLRYSSPRNKLIVVIHKCMELIGCDDEQMSDPYVKVYLLPDRSSSSKRKTQVVKNNLNPIFDETFDWAVPLSEVPTRTLEIAVKNSTGMFSKERTLMGILNINLAQWDVSKTSTEWYELDNPEGDKSKISSL